jgi:hypothetical protein
VALFGRRFAPVRRLGKEFGLSFAAVEIVHLSLVVRLCVVGDTPSLPTFILFGTAAIFTYLIALISVDAIRIRIHNRLGWGIKTIGLHVIAYAFAFDFFREPFGHGLKHILAYLPFAALSLIGPALRLAAAAKPIALALRQRDMKPRLKQPAMRRRS